MLKPIVPVAKTTDRGPSHVGCIVNISSLLATHAGRGASVYSASKAGIVGMFCSIVHRSALRALGLYLTRLVQD